MSKRFGFTMKGFRLSVEDASGNFVPLNGIGARSEPDAVEVKPLTERQMRPIICEPIPGRDGVEYVQDWLGLTHFG